MRNIFLFIRRYFIFFIFLILEVVSLWFLFNYNRFHRAKFLGVATEMTGRINNQYNKVEDYFSLKEENHRVHKLNDSLLNLLKRNFIQRDTSMQLVKDSVPYDTAGHYRRYFFRDATVIYNTVNDQKNYLQLNRGSNQGIKDNMEVVGSDGSVVGVVMNVSPNFCQVMSLLHVQSTITASLKKGGESGTVEFSSGTIVSPGLRYAINIGKLQIVPGLAIPISFTSTAGLSRQAWSRAASSSSMTARRSTSWKATAASGAGSSSGTR